jgi:hypothetical protein
MKEFKFLDYYTKYSCEGSISKRLSGEACFSTIFNKVDRRSKILVTIYLYKGVDQVINHRSNACFFNKKEIKNHINILKSLCNFNFKIKDTKEAYIVELELSELLPIYHKYILTWVRYLYEYPYNVLLKDAYQLKKNNLCFKWQSIATLFNLILSCSSAYVRPIHQIPMPNTLAMRYTIAKLKQRLNTINRLNDVYISLIDNPFKIPNHIDGYELTDLEYWEMGFEEREPVYMSAYKLLNKR